MAKWKTDPLFRAILTEALALWAELDEACRPELIRVENRSSEASAKLHLEGPVLDVWLIDDSGLRLAPVLRREAYEPGESRGEYSQFGLLRFSISKDGRRVAFDFRVGPQIGGELAYDVDGQGEDLQLLAEAASLSA